MDHGCADVELSNKRVKSELAETNATANTHNLKEEDRGLSKATQVKSDPQVISGNQNIKHVSVS